MRESGIAGKIAFVTGASGGIGAAVVRALLDEGATVVATDRDTEALARLANANAPDRLVTAPLDVTQADAVERAVAAVEERTGPIDILANVAGVLSASPVAETDLAEWQRVFAVNATGVFLVSKAVAARMQPRGRGVIVTVSSNAAGIPRHGMAAYAASKAASTMFTRSLGLELAPHGIRCNIVAPGSTLTPMQEGMWTDGNGPARVIAGAPEIFRTGIPLGRIAAPEDIADAVVFLASDRARHITMADLYVDGGATQRG
ncbi:2,3-dihydro-2,3-dihydroxybenzoate dehydrogenase [Pseudochelatococcus lubricantis]|uniref:2,3-dihydro-2,3-dihydroxybenzoate dehydrogenase n=1 Tax=Pseudochelatococcus lubricantis TaxID=1538102 RepID=A0ABX0UX05_9HYPH|nr:2,3-dihydro-2,3-dihydroxybenzoate dehydrogenase [Pseudochelatococcus lubricantis]NIJ56409.1 2,3-dihydro-2,3-dihydroxybenzoate dehydrogenase [Pseudochelatococcus lubricantis]